MAPVELVERVGVSRESRQQFGVGAFVHVMYYPLARGALHRSTTRTDFPH
jgi:hypothetical protein